MVCRIEMAGHSVACHRNRRTVVEEAESSHRVAEVGEVVGSHIRFAGAAVHNLEEVRSSAVVGTDGEGAVLRIRHCIRSLDILTYLTGCSCGEGCRGDESVVVVDLTPKDASSCG